MSSTQSKDDIFNHLTSLNVKLRLKYSTSTKKYLKVHKIENFFGFDFEVYTVSLLVMLKYEGFVTNNFGLAIMGGGRIIPHSLKTTGNKNCFESRPKKIYIF